MELPLPGAKIKLNENGTLLECVGHWITAKVDNIKKQFGYITYLSADEVSLDVSQIAQMDTVGAWLLFDLTQQLTAHHKNFKIVGMRPDQSALFELVSQQKAVLGKSIPHPFVPNFFYFIGEQTVTKTQHALDFFAFFGEFFLDALYLLRYPRQIQWRSFLKVIDEAGFQALPIVALLLFFIGIVISYQTGLQLRQVGANIYIVSLTGVSVLQEFGPLITAIIIAGRTGSAYTSQLGMMKVNQEIEALQTMGLSAMMMLVMPRFFGLLIVLPLLTIWADIFGVIGSMLMAKQVLGFNYLDYLTRFPRDIRLVTYVIGIMKTPVFAFIIAMTGCFQGFTADFSSESVGRQTTRSVVQAIFLIILTDGIFAILFGW